MLYSERNMIRCAVIADPHYYDPSLGVEGPAFERMLRADRKMLKENKPLWDALMWDLSAGGTPDIVLVPGDITKDGERVNHVKAAAYFHALQEQGKRVFVLPGNHDIYNPRAARYEGNQKIPVESISPGEFKEIYFSFGYERAFSRDHNSLSYAAALSPDLWLIAIDSCIYEDNPEELIVDGMFSDTTLKWVEQILHQAKSEGKQVIGMTHHNVVPHIRGQELAFSYTLAKNRQDAGNLFARLGMKILFTGHFHGQSISKLEGPEEEDFLYEIQTGSLVCYPSPYRLITLNPKGELSVVTKYVELTEGAFREGGFKEYSQEFLYSSLARIIGGFMKKLHGLGDEEISALAPPFAQAMVSFYIGDSSGGEDARRIITKLYSSGDPEIQGFAGIMESLWFRDPPADNNININLKNGSWRKSCDGGADSDTPVCGILCNESEG